jgi:hypothetical protein
MTKCASCFAEVVLTKERPIAVTVTVLDSAGKPREMCRTCWTEWDPDKRKERR